MRRATPLEQVQTVPLMRHVQGQVGRTVECSHRKGTERGLLPAFSTPFVIQGLHRQHSFSHRLRLRPLQSQ
jgi:hypothetical protein